MINLSEENVKELTDYANQIPTMYGLPILQYLQKLVEDQKTDEENGLQE
jgi:hypothetical protein